MNNHVGCGDYFGYVGIGQTTSTVTSPWSTETKICTEKQDILTTTKIVKDTHSLPMEYIDYGCKSARTTPFLENMNADQVNAFILAALGEIQDASMEMKPLDHEEMPLSYFPIEMDRSVLHSEYPRRNSSTSTSSSSQENTSSSRKRKRHRPSLYSLFLPSPTSSVPPKSTSPRPLNAFILYRRR